MNYGLFINTVVDFLIIAVAIFVAVKLISRLHKKAEAAPAPEKFSAEAQLLTEIRDLLKNK